MFDDTPDAIAKLIRPGRVHRNVYTDPAIFALEMARIFGRAWVYIGHASQIPNPGDYLTSTIGLQPVIMCRHRDGEVYVLFNRCSHRGALVCNERRGNAGRLSCPYHGWSFDTNGNLLNVPVPEGCAVDFNSKHFGLGRAPRVSQYRGFVFACCRAEGPSLDAYLGPMTANIDDLVDRAPDGELIVDAGVHRYRYPGNWKLQVENVLDSYHVPFAHASTVSPQGFQFSRREGDQDGARVVDTKSRTAQSWRDRNSFVVGRGHGWTSNTQLKESERSSPVFDAYKAALVAKVGKARAEDILTPRFHNSLIYPNMSIMALNVHIRVIKPIAVDQTEVNIYPVRFKGAPDAMHARNIRLLNVTHAAASFVQTDDLEVFSRIQRGLDRDTSAWVDISRGLGVEEEDHDRGVTRGSAMQELAMRAQYDAWLNYMSETP